MKEDDNRGLRVKRLRMREAKTKNEIEIERGQNEMRTIE